jgi:hypothetical protein
VQIDSYQKTISELQMQLERCRHELDEAQQRSKQDRSEKDVKLMLLESEVDRVRSTVTSKNDQLEELMEQRQRDRSQVLELKEQLSHLSSDLTTAQADLEHEQAHRKRLELRLRSFMTTPELNNNNNNNNYQGNNNNNNFQGNNNNTSYEVNGTVVGGVDYDSLDGGSSSSTGGMVSANYYQQYRDRDDSDFSVRPSSRSGLVSYTMADKIGNNSNNNSNYQSNNKLSMQHTEDYYDNSDCNTVLSTSTRVLPYNSSASTGTYNSNNNNNNSYSQSSSNSTYVIHDDGSSDHRILQPTPLQLQQSSSASSSSLSSSTPRADHHRMAHHSYSESVSSPALDRVSAALAARAVADSSSSIGGGGGGGTSDRFSSNRAASSSSSSSSSSTIDSKSALRLAQQQRNVGRHPNNSNNNYQGNNNNISSISGGNTSMTSQGISLISDPDVLSYDANDDSPSAAMAYNSNTYSGTNINNMGGNNSVGVSAEETIRRTQMVLNQRMGLNVHATASSMGPAKGASTLKLTETIHHAHAMYPPSPVTSRGSCINAQDRDGTGGGLMMDVPVPAPQLRPISPPIVRHTMMMMGGGGASIALGDEDMSSDFMVEYFNSNNNSSSSGSSPSGMIISTINSSVASTAAIASSASTLQATSGDKRSSSASKKKKSSSSSSSSSSKQNQIAVETGRHYGGLEDALQLPKISHLNHGGKKK